MTLNNINFTEEEFHLICDALNSVMLMENSGDSLNYQLVVNIGSAMTFRNLNTKWGVRGDELMKKLRTLNPMDALELEKKVEQFF